MPDFGADQVRHLAELARIDLDDDELERLTAELATIVESVARVSEVATSDIPSTSHPLPLVNGWRDDVPTPSLSMDEALSGAPDRQGDRFRVPAILDEE